MKRLFIAILTLSFPAIFSTAGSALAASVSGKPDVETLTLIDKEEPSMKAVSGGIELTATPSDETTFLIYSITGQLVKSVKAEAGSTVNVELSGGCYIVRCTAWAKKIIVRNS